VKDGEPKVIESAADRDSGEAFNALFQIFSDPKLRCDAHFRCPIDGPSEFDRAWDSAFEKTFGPNVEYNRWVGRLRRLGLISW
jgi:hypothetical protein